MRATSSRLIHVAAGALAFGLVALSCGEAEDPNDPGTDAGAEPDGGTAAGPPRPSSRGLPEGVPVDLGEVVLDVTGLAWEKSPSGRYFTWTEAAAHCRALVLGGAGVWRLPEKSELQTALRAEGLAEESSDWFWTATAGRTDTAWALSAGGASNSNDVRTAGRVRCVR